MYLTDVDVKLKCQRRTRKCLLPLLLLTVFLAGAAISAEESYAYPKVYLNPGDTFDVTKVSDNTTVFIKKSGDYTLMGQSRKVRVLVQTGGVDLYLADGLDINCSALSYVGSRTAPIWVENQGGTVRLISKKNAQIRLEGYMCPAIRKEGTSTKLVFETEDPGVPGNDPCLQRLLRLERFPRRDRQHGM